MDEPYKEFLHKIDSSDHPFSEIVLMASFESRSIAQSVTEWVAATFNVPVIIQNRTDSIHMDLCDAKVTTDYFMMTDVHHAPVAKVDLMFAPDGSNRPVVPFVPSESSHCPSYKACADTMSEAREFYPTMDRFVLSDELLFHRELRKSFCEEWNHRREEKYLPTPAEKVISPPTATCYIAYLSNLRIAGSVYFFSNAITQGARRIFVPAEPRMPLALKYNLVDVIPSESKKDSKLPLFWHIPQVSGRHIALCQVLILVLQ